MKRLWIEGKDDGLKETIWKERKRQSS